MSEIFTSQQERIEDALDAVIEAHPGNFDQAVANPMLRNWFVGRVMRALRGFANPHLVAQVVAEKFAAVASRQEITDAAFPFNVPAGSRLDRMDWAALYLSSWPNREQFLVASRHLREAREFAEQYEQADVAWTVVAFGQSLMGRRFDRIIALTPVGGFNIHEDQYVREDLAIRLAPGERVRVVPQ